MRFFTFILLGLFAIAAGFSFATIQNQDNPSQLFDNLSNPKLAYKLLQIIEQEISAPPPLRGSINKDGQALTINGILAATNQHRAADNQAPLTSNTTLNQAANNKLNDMFTQQYFDHVSPDGTGPADVVNGVGYQYIKVGENLALGNFDGDADIVQAWMDSPGHRANILSSGFTEIGIAARSGTFEGHQTWLAVQTFGLPADACPEPDPTLQASFDNKQTQADQLIAQLDSAKQQLDTGADTVNQLAAEAKQLAKQGNTKIEEGNQQIKQGNQIAQDTSSQEQAQPYWDKGKKLQQESEALVEQAKAKQTSAQQQQTELKQTQSNYNSQVTTINKLDDDLQYLADQLNKEISIYNSCATNFSR